MMALPSNLSIVAKASRPKMDDTLLKSGHLRQSFRYVFIRELTK